jgi:hypothetical protein
LVLDAVTSEVEVDQQESFDSVQLIKEQSELGLFEGLLFRSTARFSASHVFVNSFDLFVEALDLLLCMKKLIFCEFWDFRRFGVLKRE